MHPVSINFQPLLYSCAAGKQVHLSASSKACCERFADILSKTGSDAIAVAKGLTDAPMGLIVNHSLKSGLACNSLKSGLACNSFRKLEKCHLPLNVQCRIAAA